jgi:hypothetical protein
MYRLAIRKKVLSMKLLETTTVLTIGLAITACSSTSLPSTSTSTSTSTSSHILKGTIHTTNAYYGQIFGRAEGDVCEYESWHPYNFLGAGQKIIVKDSKGETIALGGITKGTVLPAETNKAKRLWCFMSFTVNDPIPDSNFYAIVLNNGQEISVSRAEIESASWNVNLTIP